MPGLPRNQATDEISRRLGVTKRHAKRIANRLVEDGQSLSDEELIAKLSPMEKEKLRKVIVEREFKQEQLAILRREHVHVGEVRTLGIKLGSGMSEAASEAIANWPAELAGRTEVQIREHLTRFWDGFIEQHLATVRKYD